MNVRWLALLLPVAVSLSACAAPVDGDAAAQSADSLSVASAAAGQLDVGDGIPIALAAVRVAGTPVDTLGGVTPLEADVGVGAPLARVLGAVKAARALHLTLAGGAYDLGAVQVVAVSMPAASASKRGPGAVTVKFTPEVVRSVKGGGETIASPAPQLVTGFTVSFTGGVRAAGISTSPSAFLAPVTIPAGGRDVTLTLTMNAADAAAWLAWPDGEARDGELRYVGADGTTTVVALSSAKPTSKRPTGASTGTATITVLVHEADIKFG